MIDEPDQIEAYRRMVLEKALRMEILGMRHSSGRSAASEIRRLIGSSTNSKKRLLEEYRGWLKSRR